MKLVISLIACFLSATLLVQGQSVSELRKKWEGISDEINDINNQQRAASLPVAPSEAVPPSPGLAPASEPTTKVDPKAPRVTATLVAWISSQSENIVEEMEAIANYFAGSEDFSVVQYLRYLRLFDSLKVIASQQISELKWVNKKAKVFSKVYKLALDTVAAYLHDLNEQLLKIELAEPKSKQVEVSAKWLELYQTIKFISTHAPVNSEVARSATELLTFSPNGTIDKQRSIRFEIKTHTISR